MPMPIQLRLNALAAAMLLFATSAMAADVAEVTLDNGTRVRLKDDFTWEYVITQSVPVNTAPASMTLGQMSDTSEAPQAQATTDTLAEEAPQTERLTPQAMSHKQLLGHTVKEGIRVEFTQARWHGDKLGLNFTLSSTSKEHIIGVEVEASFFDDSGERIKQETLEVWRAITRMPETYLRNGQTRPSDLIWIEGIDPKRWQQQHLSLKIFDIESR
jgi:opacity protein-like surface antigen